jgi:hypothetical protein
MAWQNQDINPECSASTANPECSASTANSLTINSHHIFEEDTTLLFAGEPINFTLMQLGNS